MTLTRILPTLRRSIPEPLDASRWPAHTHPTTTDVVIAGVSLARLADWCTTPCVHTDDDAAAIVATVTAVAPHPGGGLDIRLDADIAAVAAETAQARLIGRASPAPLCLAHLGPLLLELPTDLHNGDRVALPAHGRITRSQVDLHRAARSRAEDASAGAGAPDPSGHCAR
ncbi:hypothetical protein IT072_01100 [Leifsonia sp. ZF2019]|uniref:hypothetical protein n=1 Tax=Leifsonia sp. ZF2019 TaxID=2781978 RepID=UPI001CBF4BBE|nr:hypothetical protein [Leifsonia sp. ZF2019]UAJ79728.1 hypothetical protein IT072_01100 [Leifsonia sp. ZF2019]